MSTISQKRQQVAAQCSAVVHLATSLADIHSDYAKLFLNGSAEDLIDMVGDRTAAFMDILGDLLNGMDAVTEEDGKLDQVFAEAHRIWPQPAATPDLLEALEAAQRDLNDLSDFYVGHQDHNPSFAARVTLTRRMARTAIAKARNQP